MWKKAVAVYYNLHSSICLGGLKETMKTLWKDTWFLDRYLKPVSPKYERKFLIPWRWLSVPEQWRNKR